MSCHYSQTRQVFVFKLFPSPATGSGPGFVVLFWFGSFLFFVFFLTCVSVHIQDAWEQRLNASYSPLGSDLRAFL